jgi:putative ABC transport system substrate-binding protein
MTRREFIILLGGAVVAWPVATRAQQPRKSYRVGLLSGAAAISATDERRKAIIEGLGARGFVEGKDFIFEQRYAEAHNERLNGLAAELKAANMDVVITFGYPAALAAKMSAKDIPIVVTAAGDPVATGLVESLSRPGATSPACRKYQPTLAPSASKFSRMRCQDSSG